MTDESSTAVGCTFLVRLGALPLVADTISKAKEVYQRTQDYASVSVVVSAASSSARAVSMVLPVTTLLRPVGGLPAVNQWACQGLDKVQTWAPIISKPTAEVVSEVKGKLVKVLAGDESSTASLPDAVVIRAGNTIMFLSNTRGGRMAVQVATLLVNNANTWVDTYLPTVEGEAKETDSDGGLVVKTSALALKTRLRLYHTTHHYLHPDVTCVDFSTTHLALLIRSWATEWCKAKLQVSSGMTLKNFSICLAQNATGKLTVNFHKVLSIMSLPASDTATTKRSYTGCVPAGLEHLLVQFLVCLKAFLNAALKTSLDSWVMTEEYLRRILTARNIKDSTTGISTIV